MGGAYIIYMLLHCSVLESYNYWMLINCKLAECAMIDSQKQMCFSLQSCQFQFCMDFLQFWAWKFAVLWSCNFTRSRGTCTGVLEWGRIQIPLCYRNASFSCRAGVQFRTVWNPLNHFLVGLQKLISQGFIPIPVWCLAWLSWWSWSDSANYERFFGITEGQAPPRSVIWVRVTVVTICV